MSEDVEEEQATEEEPTEVEITTQVPLADAGNYVFVCNECGSNLIAIPYYNRFYCENCGLHY